jgi:hypothetical protein
MDSCPCERSSLLVREPGSAEADPVRRRAPLCRVHGCTTSVSSPRFDNYVAPFEDAGGDVGWVFGAGAGWPAERRDRVKEILVRHIWDEVDPAPGRGGPLAA